jgi:hypothetical protein
MTLWRDAVQLSRIESQELIAGLAAGTIESVGERAEAIGSDTSLGRIPGDEAAIF